MERGFQVSKHLNQGYIDDFISGQTFVYSITGPESNMKQEELTDIQVYSNNIHWYVYTYIDGKVRRIIPVILSMSCRQSSKNSFQNMSD